MPRATRTLLIVVAVGLVGVLALTWMARRYASLQPRASVVDVVPAPQVPPPAPEAPPVVPPPPVRAEGPRESDLAEIDRFVAVRSALKAVIAEQPGAARQLAEQLGKGDASQLKPLQLNLVFLMKFRLTREQAIVEAGWTFERYRSVRDSVDAWRAGEGPEDPSSKAALDAKRTALEGAFLGELEALDRVADSGMKEPD
ncbi:MAG TPA: hypothetical protein VF139_14720 [Candidatus Polarisedimenticolaceae bacterium]